MISSDEAKRFLENSASEIFAKRGWLEMKTGTGEKYYLVKNKMLKVPDNSLPKVTPQELELFRGLEHEEKGVLLSALGIFKGKLT